MQKYYHPLNLWTENTNSIVQHFGMVLTIFVHSNEKWYLYDGLKEYNLRNSGLQISDTRFNEPQGYSLSYLIYCAYEGQLNGL